MVGTTTLTKQTALLDRWLPTLQQIPAVDIIWLEGSLAADRATPSSDIDIRFGIADAAYQQLWETDRTPLLAGLGEHLLLENTFVRALTADGVIVEASAYKTSKLDNLALYEWKILFNRMPENQPSFRKSPICSLAETWPAKEPLTPELVRRKMNFCLMVMAETPAEFYNLEINSAVFTLDFMRDQLIHLFYERIGVFYCKRAKHFSQIFPQEWLADLTSTYLPTGASPLNYTHLAEALIHLFKIIGKHLQALSDQAGGGFESKWYWRLYDQMTTELSQFQPSA